MATLAAIRAASSSMLCASPASTSSLHSPHSDCRNGPQISVVAAARPSAVLIHSSTPFPTSSVAAAALSSSCCYVPSRSGLKQFKAVKRRGRDSVRVSGASTSPRCESESSTDKDKATPNCIYRLLAIRVMTPFGYTRKDVIGIGLGLLAFGFALKYGLELFGVDSIKAGNAVQLIMVLGLTVGWISTYVFRVSSKEMTYAKQLKDYENKVMEKRLEEMPEAELESMLAQIEEEKRVLRESRDKFL